MEKGIDFSFRRFVFWVRLWAADAAAANVVVVAKVSAFFLFSFA